jgi:hypothetical protein
VRSAIVIAALLVLLAEGIALAAAADAWLA